MGESKLPIIAKNLMAGHTCKNCDYFFLKTNQGAFLRHSLHHLTDDHTNPANKKNRRKWECRWNPLADLPLEYSRPDEQFSLYDIYERDHSSLPIPIELTCEHWKTLREI